MDAARPDAAQAKELDRLTAFSDGVFSIAITLLVLGIEVPDVSDSDLGAAVSELGSSLSAYFIGFAVIGLFWFGHHRAFALLERSNGRLVLANMLLLCMISLMPFTTGVLGNFGDEPLGVALYAANVGLAFLFDGLIDQISLRDRLYADEVEREAGAIGVLDIARPALFLVSIPVAFAISPSVAQWMWILLIPLPAIVDRTFGPQGTSG